MESTSASLLELLKFSDEDLAWDRFVRVFTPFIYRIARNAGLDEFDAQDLVQDVFLLLARKINDFRYDSERSFRAWLHTVTLNKIREKFRVRRVLLHYVGTDCDLVVEQDHVLFEETEYREWIVAQAFQLMRSEFSPTTWQACWEHVVSGRNAAEIGEELGISEGAVYAAKFRVLRRLRHELEGLRE